MKYLFYILTATILLVNQVDAQVKVRWEDLADVTFESRYHPELGENFYFPIFGEGIRAKEGREVLITGYIIPVDLEEGFYVLSAFPFAACFFCGGAGPESVVELQFKSSDHRQYQTDERLTFIGKLKLNSDDVYQMNYILQQAEEY